MKELFYQRFMVQTSNSLQIINLNLKINYWNQERLKDVY